MTPFFIPGVSGEPRVVESAYGEMRRQIEREMGRPPTPRRILSVWTRRGHIDCVTEVGRRDPLRGGTVVAIFDMGRHQPYVVWWRQDADGNGNGNGAREALGCDAYSVLEFDL